MPETCTTTLLASFTTEPIRVTYADTDRMNHAYHANYLVWFEIGRVELLRSLGQSYKQWEDEQKVFLPVRRCSVEYLQPALYDDLLLVVTTIVHITRATIRFDYQLLRFADNALLASGMTEHIFLSETGRILRTADKLLPQLFRKPTSRAEKTQ